MKRTLVDLQECDLRELDKLAREASTSRAALLRDAVAEYLVKRDRLPAHPPKPLSGFGALQGHLGDGLTYQQTLRREWE